MAMKINVTNVEIDTAEVKVIIDNPMLLTEAEIEPEGRMLADSENIAFIYILNVNDDFCYLNFPIGTWEKISDGLQSALPFYLQLETEKRVPLVQFSEEINYYISNIKDNRNYGDKMIQAVINAFSR